MYHRLDIYNQTNDVCLIKKKIAISSTSIFKLSRDVFQKPISYYEDETLASITKLADFMSMKSNVPPNEIKSADVAHTVRQAVVASSFLEKDVWMKDTSLGSLYILWRYFGTEEGVMRVYPGTKLHPYYDPRARPWYIQAKASPEQLILTAPYIDAFTGTMLVSLIKAIYRKSGSKGKLIAGVAGIDLSVPYFQSILLQNVQVCDEKISGQRCLVIDQAGYLIFHKSFLTKKLYNTTHVIEVESVIADDMLKQGYMKKNYCLGYFNEKGMSTSAHVQYFYTLNHVTKTETRQTNDNCLKYIITPVIGTNLFVIHIIKNRCSSKANLCRCTNSPQKKCVVSHPNNLRICECPCYDYKVCLSDLPSSKSSLLCTPPSKKLSINVTYTGTTNWVDDKEKYGIKDCVNPKCNKSKSVLECDRIGCQWCYKFPNGTHVADNKKFCNYSGQCFNYLKPPTTTMVISTIRPTPPSTIRPTPSGLGGGAIAGIVIGAVVFIVLVVIILYCLKGKRQSRKSDTPNDVPRQPSPVVIVNKSQPDVVQESDWF